MTVYRLDHLELRTGGRPSTPIRAATVTVPVKTAEQLQFVRTDHAVSLAIEGPCRVSLIRAGVGDGIFAVEVLAP